MLRPDADVAVVGAGPSGSWSAWHLARSGARVLLFDPSHPREKPCGGGVTGRALSLVAPALQTSLPAVRIQGARFVDSQSGAASTVSLAADGRDLVVVSRTVFDGALLSAAEGVGATLVRERVAEIEPRPSGFVVRTASGRRVTVGLVVGADGANSLVRRRLDTAFSRGEISIATGYFVHGATGSDVIVEFVGDPPGYIWSFPRPDHLAVGICAQADTGWTAEALRARVSRWIEQTGVAPRDAELEPYSWPIPSLTAPSLRRLRVSGPGWILTGDAAGLVDPITREGIYFALRSADFAASAIAAAPSTASVNYSEQVGRDIVSELVRAARLKAGFFRPQFTRLLVHALASSPAVARIMADLVAGTQTYSALKWRLLSTLEWRLAWRLLRLERDRPATPGYLAR